MKLLKDFYKTKKIHFTETLCKLAQKKMTFIISSPNLKNYSGLTLLYSVINNILLIKWKPKSQTTVPLKDKHISEKLNAKHNNMSHFPFKQTNHVIFSSIQNRKREIHMPNKQEIW